MDWRYSPWLREARMAMGINVGNEGHITDLFDYGYDEEYGKPSPPPRSGFLRPGSRLVERLRRRADGR